MFPCVLHINPYPWDWIEPFLLGFTLKSPTEQIQKKTWRFHGDILGFANIIRLDMGRFHGDHGDLLGFHGEITYHGVIKWHVQPVADLSNLTIHKLFRIIDEIVGGIFH